MDPNQYSVEKDADWVRRWEDREQEFRKILQNYKDEMQNRQSKLLGTMSGTLSQQQAIILKIREIPLVGEWIIRWAERNSDYQLPPPETRLPPPTTKHHIGTRG